MRRRNVLTVTLGLMTLVGLPAFPASAGYPAGDVGHDVSYPQCTSPGASTTTVDGLGASFGVVGLTGGRPFGSNSCAAAEYSWAAGLPDAPALYMNTANPAPTSSFYWPASGARDPALCTDATSTTDPGCAYDYGWHAAADALSTRAAAIPNAATLTWWLDVETANSWNGNGASNAADLQGTVDYLRSHGVPHVGLYSTSSQWSTITGGLTTSTYASYAQTWAPEFTAQYPLINEPTWIAGAGNAASASAACTTTFTGGPTWLAQYADGSGYDADLACGAPTSSSFSLGLSPTKGSVKRSGTVSSTVSVSESGPAQSVSLAASGAPAGVTVALQPTVLTASGSSRMTITVASGTVRGTYSVRVTGTGSAGGTHSVTYALTVR